MEIKRQAAFEGGNKMLKGALHCHTTRSDGDLSPEDTMALHKEHGYDFMAITDHRRYNRISYLPESGITVIPAMEYDAGICDGGEGGFRCFHTVVMGYDNDENGIAHEERFESGKVKDQFEFQKYLDDFHAKNNITFYCHPEWSSTPARLFDKMKGQFAMEVWNSGCVIENDMDKDAPYWDEILGQGVKIFGVATDDGHKAHQHCCGWVMVNAENSVTAILNALQEGRFYSSTGAVIKDFYVKDDEVFVECDPCKRVCFKADRHPTRVIDSKNGELMTAVSMKLHDDWDYIRVEIFDENGKCAWSNPIFISENK